MNQTPDETARNHTQGFSTRWPVYKDYQVSEDVMQPRGDIAYSYAPVVHSELPQEIAKLQWGDTTAARHFAKEYGLLGYGSLIDCPSSGDPLLWIWIHAKTIRLCLDITSLLQKQDTEILKELLKELTLPAATTSELAGPYWPAALVACQEKSIPMAWDDTAWHISTSTSGDVYDIPPYKEAQEVDVLQLAKKIRRELINENMTGVHCRLLEHTEDEQAGFGFRAMIEIAYWHLAHIVTKKKIEYCIECGAAFAQITARQRFCPPHGRQQESACAVRRRVKKHLNKTHARVE